MSASRIGGLKQLLGDRILIRRDPAPTQTSTGLALPNAGGGEVTNTGTVVAVGERSGHPECVALGARILFGGFSGMPVKFNGEDFLVLKGDEIVAILE